MLETPTLASNEFDGATTGAVEMLTAGGSSSSSKSGTTTIKYVREALATAPVQLLSLRRGSGVNRTIEHLAINIL
jgi:hypothetical protein